MYAYRVLSFYLIASVLMVGSVAGSADASTDPESPAAKQAKAEYDAAVAKAEAELAAARKTYLEKLDAALKAAMMAGDLPEANRIDALRKAVAQGPAAGARAAHPQV